MRKLIVLYFVFIILPIVNAVCIVPTENLEIKENTVFCYGEYNIKNGIDVIDDNIAIDCNNSILFGNGVSYGILSNNKNNVSVQNCNISNYEVGIYLKDTNNSVIKGNYLTKNKFGIALFNSFNNDVNDNFLFENINDTINYLPISIIQEKTIKTEAKKETSTPEKIMEEVIKIKKPFLQESEVANEVNLIFNKYFNITQENLEIRRTIFYNESDKSTVIIIYLKPKKVLLNVSIYEKIPKCISAYVNQIFFETGGYEVVNDDPLILWTFSRLDKEKELSYKVFKNIDEECKNLLFVFGIATGFEKFENKKEEKGKAGYLLVFSIIVAVVLVSYFALTKRHGR